MKIEWKSNFETGIEAIDLQPQFFIGLIGRIQNAFSKSTDKNYENRLIAELEKIHGLPFYI